MAVNCYYPADELDLERWTSVLAYPLTRSGRVAEIALPSRGCRRPIGPFGPHRVLQPPSVDVPDLLNSVAVRGLLAVLVSDLGAGNHYFLDVPNRSVGCTWVAIPTARVVSVRRLLARGDIRDV